MNQNKFFITCLLVMLCVSNLFGLDRIVFKLVTTTAWAVVGNEDGDEEVNWNFGTKLTSSGSYNYISYYHQGDYDSSDIGESGQHNDYNFSNDTIYDNINREYGDKVYLSLQGWESDGAIIQDHRSTTDDRVITDTPRDVTTEYSIKTSTFSSTNPNYRIYYTIWWNYRIPLVNSMVFTASSTDSRIHRRYTLTNDADFRVTGLDYQVSTSSSFSSFVYNTSTTNTYFDINNLTPSTTYYVRIKPKNEAGTALDWKEYSFTTASNSAPVLTNQSAATLNENILISTTVVDYNATDSDGDGITYSLSGTDASYFNINSSTGVVTFKNSPNYEVKSRYDFSVRATDDLTNGSLSDSDGYTVYITDVNEAPVLVNQGSKTLNENISTSTTVVDYNATDIDAGDVLSYSLSGTDASYFNIGSSTGIVTFKTAPNYETKTSYTFTVTVSDGSLSDSDAFTVNITDVNDAPILVNQGSTTLNENIATTTTVVDYNATDQDSGDVITYLLSGTDASYFNIDSSTGVVTFKSSPNYETKSSYTFTVIARDNDSTPASDSDAFTVNITDINEAPVLTPQSSITLNENIATTTTVVDYNATDQDSGDVITYLLGGTDASYFNIDSSTGVVTFKTSPNYETKSSYTFTVIARDDYSTPASDSDAFTVNITDVNEAPVLTSNGGASTAAINVAENTTAVTTVIASDVDNNTLTYSITGGADQNRFSIANGVLTFATAPNYENPTDTDTNNTYIVEVTATDDGVGTLTDTQTITVTVTDVNDIPVISGTPSTTVNDSSSYSFIPISSDEDINDTLTFSISNKPTWASFNTNTGRLSGVPTDSDIGVTSNIVITVKDESDAAVSLNGFDISVLYDGDKDGIADALDLDDDNDGIPDTDDLDDDNDGIPDEVEGSKAIPPRDTDNDGIPDYKDPDSDNDGSPDIDEGTGDSDGDGIPDYIDVDAIGIRDTDGDGIPDSDDLDDDNDGILDIDEGSNESPMRDTDKDGIPDYKDTDADNDGIPDVTEGTVDTDNDGVPDSLDTDSDNDGVSDIDEGTGDSDGDGIPDNKDTDTVGIKDSDGDGIPDATDPDDDNDGIPDVDEGTADTDGDGIPDSKDTDSDGDGIPDIQEGNMDTDGDGIPDYKDTDADNDGVPDSDEGYDGSKDNTTNGTLDSDGDGIPDATDPDDDNDGIPDVDEGTADTDGDGIPDYKDTDSDNDGVSDIDEGKGDRNGDGILDYKDSTSTGTKDTDNDGIIDSLDNDDDNDGISDSDEGAYDFPIRDSDSDGIPDYKDTDSDNDGISDTTEGGDLIPPRDTDADGIPDYIDEDSDNNGVLDSEEGNVDSDGDGVPDTADSDDDNDGIPDILEGGNENPPRDTNNNGVPDSKDTDSDSDGKLDINEGIVDDDLDGIPNYIDSNDQGSDEAIDNGDGTETHTFKKVSGSGDDQTTKFNTSSGKPLDIDEKLDGSSEITIYDPSSKIHVKNDGGVDISINETNGSHDISIVRPGVDISIIEPENNIFISTPVYTNVDNSTCQYDIEVIRDGSDMITKHYLNKNSSNEVVTTVIMKIPNASLNVDSNNKVIHTGEVVNANHDNVKVTGTVSCDGSITTVTELVGINSSFVSVNDPGSTVVIDVNGDVDTTTSLSDSDNQVNSLEGLNFKIDSNSGEIVASKVFKDKSTDQVVYTEAETYLLGTKLTENGNGINNIDVDLSDIRLVKVDITDTSNNIITSTTQIDNSISDSDIQRISNGEDGAISSQISLGSTTIVVNNKLDGDIEHKVTVDGKTTQASSFIEGASTRVLSSGVSTSYDDTINSGIKTEIDTNTSGQTLHRLEKDGVITQATSEIVGSNTLIMNDENGAPKISTSIETTNTNNQLLEIVVDANSDGSAEHKLIYNGVEIKATSKIPGANTTIKSDGEIETNSALDDNTQSYAIAKPDGSVEHEVKTSEFDTKATFNIVGATTIINQNREVQTTLSMKNSMCLTKSEYVLIKVVTDINGETLTSYDKFYCNDDSLIETINTALSQSFEPDNKVEVNQINGEVETKVTTQLNQSIQF